MDLAEFEDMLDRYGDDMGRWTPERRTAAEHLLTTSPEARTAFRRARALARQFADEPRITAPVDLSARILARAAAMPEPTPPRGARLASGGWALRVAAVLVACFAAGFVLGQSLEGETLSSAALRADTNLFAPILR